MLVAEGLVAGYGKVSVLHGVSLVVREAAITGVFGSNGAGKTTTLRTLSGLVRPARGRITIDGQRTGRMEADAVARAGVAMVPEGRGVLGSLTVSDNLLLGAHHMPDGVRREEELERVLELFPPLRQRWRQLGATLSGGEQQMLAIARALVRRPRYLLIDEMSLGLAPLVVAELFSILPQLAAAGTGILLVEQFVHRTMEIASYCYVLEKGRITVEGPAEELRGRVDTLQAAYLGQRRATARRRGTADSTSDHPT